MLSSDTYPKHIAVIMDGNGRWAKKRLLPRTFGHQKGVETVRLIVEACRKKSIPYLTLYAFSSENWQRPAKEVGFLMELFEKYLKLEIDNLIKNDVRFRVIGRKQELPENLQAIMAQAESDSADCQSLTLTLAIAYGARQEIIDAAKTICRLAKTGELSESEIDQDYFSKLLYTADFPDPDLLIRTSDECRVSNFLLWQIAYTELVFSTKLWPDFGLADFEECLKIFANRQRRFGTTGEVAELGAK